MPCINLVALPPRWSLYTFRCSMERDILVPCGWHSSIEKQELYKTYITVHDEEKRTFLYCNDYTIKMDFFFFIIIVPFIKGRTNNWYKLFSTKRFKLDQFFWKNLQISFLTMRCYTKTSIKVANVEATQQGMARRWTCQGRASKY